MEEQKARCDNIDLNGLSPTFTKILMEGKDEETEVIFILIQLPYVVGYKGFRTGVKAGNFYGTNFQDASLTARLSYKK